MVMREDVPVLEAIKPGGKAHAPSAGPDAAEGRAAVECYSLSSGVSLREQSMGSPSFV
jgi:hypothetical protein